MLLYFILIFYSYLIVKPHEVHMFSAEVNYLLANLMKHSCCGAEVIYFIFSFDMENRTLSQMSGRFYLPMFLFRVGLLTPMYIASFKALAIFYPSLPIILKLSTVVVWPVVF